VLLAFLAHSSVLVQAIVQVAAFVVPLVFTLPYVARVRARGRGRAATSAGNGSAAEHAGTLDRRPGDGAG
jgi:hypothetical protein